MNRLESRRIRTTTRQSIAGQREGGALTWIWTEALSAGARRRCRACEAEGGWRQVQRRTRQSGFGGEGRTRSAYAFPFFLPAQAERLRPGETGGTDPTLPKRCGSTRAGSSSRGNGPDCLVWFAETMF
jgi:hypothetical protein